MSAVIISLLNFKGGVGKTALVVNIATALSYHFGRKVLVIDLDPQSNASIMLLGPPRWKKLAFNQPSKTVLALLSGKNFIAPCTINDPVSLDNDINQVPYLHLVPASYHLMYFEHKKYKTGDVSFYATFWKQLMGIIPVYDFIMLDCPPNLFRTTQAAIFVSDYIYVPCNPDNLSIIGLSLLAHEINRFGKVTQEEHDIYRPDKLMPTINGIIYNAIPIPTTNALKNAETHLGAKLNSLKLKGLVSPDAKILTNRVRRATAFADSSFEYLPVLFSKNKNKQLIDDYHNLANYIHQNCK
ncbi:MAG: ParA family protein [Thermodesulfobacteriota bacterium]